MEIAPPFVPDCEPPELVQPRHRAFRHPAMPSQVRAGCDSLPGHPIRNPQPRQFRLTAGNGIRLGGRQLARLHPVSLEHRQRRQHLLKADRVVTVRGRQQGSPGQSRPLTQQVTFGARCGPVGRDMRRIDPDPGPVAAIRVGQPLPQDLKQLRPDPALRPGLHPSPAGHPGATAQFLGQHLPWNPAPQHEDDAGQTGPVCAPGPPPLRLGWFGWEQRFHGCPEFVSNEGVLIEDLRSRLSAQYPCQFC